MPRPYRVVFFGYCNSRKTPGTVKTVPYKQPEGKVSSGKMQISGRFVGDAYMRPVRFAR